MIIEWLKFQVLPAQRETFIQQDDAIWTAALAQYPGFLGKEIWISPEKPDEVTIVIRWANREAWKNIPANELEVIDRQFTEQMGRHTYQLTEAGEYQVRKFPRPT